jgi:predicted enzyme related to lactoylglutathione lyase
MTEPKTATARMVATTIDCNDLDVMAKFWASLLDVEVQAIEDGFGFLSRPEGTGIAIWLQAVPEPRAGKTRVHLDFSAHDLDATVALIERLGGSAGALHEWHGYVWRQCFDPEGNVFDVMQAPAAAAAEED